jgi:uncharacterized protein (TIGR03437 family)
MALLQAVTLSALPAQLLTNLVNFSFIGSDGFGPMNAPLVQGSDGNFYGTTDAGGIDNNGTVFKLTPAGTLTTLYHFTGPDGSHPAAGLIQGADGNFYGTTHDGGAGYVGTIFKITPGGVFTMMHSFLVTEGGQPNASLIQASDGSFYGTYPQGVFRMTPSGVTTLFYSFTSGYISPIVQAIDGNFYGTLSPLGPSSCGTVFKLSLGGVLTTLNNLDAAHCNPIVQGGLIQASDGSFYGAAAANSAAQTCTFFKMAASGVLTDLQTVPYPYCPGAPLLQARDGNLYGTSPGGSPDGAGILFKLTPEGVFTTLHVFGGTPDGSDATGALIQGLDGKFYGTTSSGGTHNTGTAFSFDPNAAASPSIVPSGAANAASFEAGIASNSWVTITGNNLSAVTDTWNQAISNGRLPTSLDGVSVSVGGQPAYIAYVSLTQINAITPTVPSGMVPVTVTNAIGTSPAINVTSQLAQPAFFRWGIYAVATHSDFSLAVKNGTFAGLTTTPAKPGDVIILWGTGFGATSPAAPPGVIVPSSTTYYAASPVAVTIGGIAATVYGAALAPGYAGLFQLAIQIPPALTNGDYEILATLASGPRSLPAAISIQQ